MRLTAIETLDLYTRAAELRSYHPEMRLGQAIWNVSKLGSKEYDILKTLSDKGMDFFYWEDGCKVIKFISDHVTEVRTHK